MTDAAITSQPLNGTISFEDGKLVYTPDEGFIGEDGAIVTLQFGSESFAYCVTFDVLEKEHGGFFSWWCLVGWLIAAIALTIIYRRNKDYFAVSTTRKALYITTSVVLLALLCLLRQFYGYLPSMLILVGYLTLAYFFTRSKQMED